MPAGLSITKEQFERDLVRIEREIHETEDVINTATAKLESLARDREIVNGVLEMYFREASESARIPAKNSLEHFSIATACEEIFREVENRWLSLADLDVELRRHGKVCSKGSIEVMLKAAPEKFEIEKRGKRNVYRMKGK